MTGRSAVFHGSQKMVILNFTYRHSPDCVHVNPIKAHRYCTRSQGETRSPLVFSLTNSDSAGRDEQLPSTGSVLDCFLSLRLPGHCAHSGHLLFEDAGRAVSAH